MDVHAWVEVVIAQHRCVGRHGALGLSHTELFDDFKFVTREELERIGLSSLIGTPQLKVHKFLVNALN